MERLTINGNSYQAREIDFNFFCALEDNNIKIADIDQNVFKTARCYAAYCMGVNQDIVGEELSKHAVKAGNMDILNEIYEVFSKKLGESDFFRTLTQTAKAETTTTTKKRASKKDQDVQE